MLCVVLVGYFAAQMALQLAGNDHVVFCIKISTIQPRLGTLYDLKLNHFFLQL